MTLAPLALVLLLGFRIEKMSLGAAKTAFWAYAALVGLFLSGIFFVYTGTSIARTLLITAATFLAMSLFGYTTRADLARTGSFLLMGLVGHHHREHRKCIPRIFDCAAGYFGGWRHRVRRTDSALRRFI
jgi:FtsH-binding integral membrane protein